ncbi:hypothetical protein BD410DRAFT_820587 [Rickenella mellea]|uniref:SWI5-dependent HO expression protein 3 n=1 Tax=Rickenella mellea TaxID=50990 RepID=A0A4Y7Q9U3_9AGAM|nr:hypothetical protein BD410DRAFT_820587 [Rickenella mellea]
MLPVVQNSSSFSPRSHSRASSRGSSRSFRASSPSISENDPVAVRNQISTLKHSIRHQQAQLQTLENIVLRGPRPLPQGVMNPSPPMAPVELPSFSGGVLSPPFPSSYNPPSSPTTKMQRRTSFDILQGLAGPESYLPLPKRDSMAHPPQKQEGIKEGVPVSFGIGRVETPQSKRVPSPTRTLSRIPVASVGHARTLAEDGQNPPRRSVSPKSPTIDVQSSSSQQSTTDNLGASTSLQVPASPNPNRRISMGGGGGNTTKVLADLQAGVINARAALENTKTQLRLSQRTVAQLTRQTEDLKDGRERLRLENEGLNNVVSRKERLLQEVLERARKAESEAASLKAQLKSEVTASKKTMRDMETQMTEAVALSHRSEREYLTLRDAVKHLSEGWKADVEGFREDMRRREEQWRKEADQMSAKYRTLLEEVKKEREERDRIVDLRERSEKIKHEWEEGFRTELGTLRDEVSRSTVESKEAGETAQEMARELARLRRLIRRTGDTQSEDEGH